MKRVIFTLCIIAVFSLLATGAFAMPQETPAYLFDLRGYGVITEDQAGNLDGGMTRAEAAAVLNRLGGLRSAGAAGSDFKIADMSREDAAYGDVVLAVSSGFLELYSDQTFQPGREISGEEYMRAVIAAIGRKSFAQGSDEKAVARQLGLLRWTGGERFRRGDALAMTAQALEARSVYTYVDNGEVKYVENQTTVKELLVSHLEQFQKGSGIVTANNVTWIYSNVPDLRLDEVQIDGVTYCAPDNDISQYVGQEVEFYSCLAQDGRRSIRAFRPTNKNHVTNIAGSDLISYQNQKLTYEDGGQKPREAEIPPQAVLIQNGKKVDSILMDENLFMVGRGGSVKLVDHTGDQKADVVFVEQYRDAVVQSVKEGTIRLKPGTSYHGENKVSIDLDNDEAKYAVYDPEGSPAELDDILEGDLISVCASGDQLYTRIYISRTQIQGSVDSVREDEVQISGESYDLLYEDLLEKQGIHVGDDVTAYVNQNGFISCVELYQGKSQYAYVAQVADSGSPFDKTFLFKLVIPGDFKETEEIDDTDESDIKITKQMLGKNTAVKTYEGSSRLKVRDAGGAVIAEKDAISTLFGNPENCIVQFTLNSEGKISSMELAKPVMRVNESTGEVSSSGDKQKYNANEKVFGGRGTGSFGADENTKVLCIPTKEDGVTCDEDYLASVELNHNGIYAVKGYDQEASTENARLIVITTRLRAFDPGNINNRSHIAILNDIIYSLDEEGDTVPSLEFLSENKKMSYRIYDEAVCIQYNEKTSLDALKPGDVFYYSLNNSDEIDNIVLIQNMKELSFYYQAGSESAAKEVYGQVVNLKEQTISEVLGRRVNRATVRIDEYDTAAVEMNVLNTPAIYVVNRRSGRSAVGSLEDVYEGRDIFAYYKNSKLQGVMVIE